MRKRIAERRDDISRRRALGGHDPGPLQLLELPLHLLQRGEPAHRRHTRNHAIERVAMNSRGQQERTQIDILEAGPQQDLDLIQEKERVQGVERDAEDESPAPLPVAEKAYYDKD